MRADKKLHRAKKRKIGAQAAARDNTDEFMKQRHPCLRVAFLCSQLIEISLMEYKPFSAVPAGTCLPA
jgi:hypothetical protein